MRYGSFFILFGVANDEERRAPLISITHSKEAPEANGINWIFKMCLMCPFHAWILTVNSIISEMRTRSVRLPRPIQS